MKILSTQQVEIKKILSLLRREQNVPLEVKKTTARILATVKSRGDRALFEFTEKFEGVRLRALQVVPQEIQKAYRLIDKKLLTALKQAKKNIKKFHRSLLKSEQRVKTQNGVRVWREFRPIEKVGLYVPGGKAPYPSTVLMLAVPAQIAGCQEIVICTPPNKNGEINPAILVAADLCRVKKIFKVGGAQAIGALAYGTDSIPKVSKIFGPGNQYVMTAKMFVYGEVVIDMPAGPSEVAILADESANPSWIAADLLSQLEHGETSQALLVTFSSRLASAVAEEIGQQMLRLSRKTIIEVALQKSFIVLVRNLKEASALINEYAPEHLEIVTKNPGLIARKINNAGSIFLGPYTSEPLGDYATGANHTLPTGGYAKMFSPLSTESFGKMVQLQEVSRVGIAKLRKTVEILAAAEGLDAHKNAVTIRFQ